jgi:hypothetical protein
VTLSEYLQGGWVVDRTRGRYQGRLDSSACNYVVDSRGTLRLPRKQAQFSPVRRNKTHMVHVFYCDKPIATCVHHPPRCSILRTVSRGTSTGHLEKHRLILAQARPRDGAHQQFDAGPKSRPALNLLRLLLYRSTVAVIPLVPLEHVLTISQPPPLSWNLVQGVTGLKDNRSRRGRPCRIWTGFKASALTSPSLPRCAASTAPVRNTSSFSARVDRSVVAFSPPATCAGQGA